MSQDEHSLNDNIEVLLRVKVDMQNSFSV